MQPPFSIGLLRFAKAEDDVALVTYGDTHTIKYTAHSQPAENVVYSTSVPANFYMYN